MTPIEAMEELERQFNAMMKLREKTDRNREALRLHERMDQFARDLDRLTDQRLAAVLRDRLGTLAGRMLTEIFEVDVP